MANYPEFSLYTFQSAEAAAALPGSACDAVGRWWLSFLVDGKFYTLFSLLFGIGFSIIISRAAARGADGMKIFYRRMSILAIIGLAHLMLVWSGDILLLYALMGMILPLFRRSSDRTILSTAIILLLLPVAIDALRVLTGFTLARFPYEKWWGYAALYGIDEANFGTWLRDASSYREVWQFLVQGAWERLYEFVEGNRYFKVLGLFLIGFVIGRHKLYADLRAARPLLVSTARIGLIIGLPLSVVYAFSSTGSRPWGPAVHSLLYAVSVYPLGFAYAAIVGLLCSRYPSAAVWRRFAAPGRMALTCYLLQSVAGMVIFYGIGFGLGASMGLIPTEGVALCVFIAEMAVCSIWLRYFRFGPFEWIWRMLTYGRFLPLRK